MSGWHLQASSSTQLSPCLQEMGSLATCTCLQRRVKESWILCLCLWEKPVLKKDNPDQESTDFWRKLRCWLQTFEQTHLSHLLSQLGFSHSQSVPVQAQSCSNWVKIPETSPNPQGVSTCADGDAKRGAVLEWWSKTLVFHDVKPLLPVLSSQTEELWAAHVGAPGFCAVVPEVTAIILKCVNPAVCSFVPDGLLIIHACGNSLATGIRITQWETLIQNAEVLNNKHSGLLGWAPTDNHSWWLKMPSQKGRLPHSMEVKSLVAIIIYKSPLPGIFSEMPAGYKELELVNLFCLCVNEHQHFCMS